MGTESEKRALTMDELCERYGWTRTTAFAAIKEGDLASFKIGRRRLVPVDEAERFMREAATRPSKAC